jgi:glyoxylase-like metal-dependent hydrolase (beta-lactamase superfamily II)
MAHVPGMHKHVVVGSLALTALLALVPLAGCRPTSHAAVPSPLGVARSSSALEAVVDQPGPVVVDTVIGADWSVTRAGLINLDDPKAKAAKLDDGLEPIVIALHAIRHPTAGLYIVDTGVERAMRDEPSHAAMSGLAANYLGIERVRVRVDTATWIAQQSEPVKGVFLTHLHTDHVSGLRDVPSTAIVFTGPGEASERHFLNMFVRPVVDSALEGKGELREWQFTPDPGGAFDGVVDVFGDGTVWALRVPGHTDGSTAYLARTPNGPVLLTGDACHTLWGWDNGVEPGWFSSDKPRSHDSLNRLHAFVAMHPGIEVRVGHQVRAAAQATR